MRFKYVVHGHPFVRQRPVRGLFPRPVRKDGRQPRAGIVLPFPSHGNDPVTDATVGVGRARVLPLRPVGPFVGMQRHRRCQRAFGFAAKGLAAFCIQGEQPHTAPRPRGRMSRRQARGAAVAAPPAGGPMATAVMPRADVGVGHHRTHPVALPPVFGHAPGGKAQRRRRETVHPHTGKQQEAVVADGPWPGHAPPGSSPPMGDRGHPAGHGPRRGSSNAADHPAGVPSPAGGGRPSSPPRAASPRRRTQAGTNRAERFQRPGHRHVGEVRPALPPGIRRRPCRRKARIEPLRNPPDRPETGRKNRFATGVPPALALDRLQCQRTAAAARPAHLALQPFDRPGVDMAKTHLHRTDIGDPDRHHDNGLAVM